ncbi:MAG TPA: DNA mismatch repair protein MutS, partial [Firmicutes bacterium]|nr:DNA mismatch repair protein MutS [Bacillota bacterium]
ATHYHELTVLAKQLEGVENLNVAVAKEGKQIVFLRKIIPGGTDQSYGIEVARLAGIPEEVLSRASEVLLELEEKGLKERSQKVAAHQGSLRQLPLFCSDEHNLYGELLNLNLEEVTPLEALKLLFQWQNRVKKKKA